MSATPLYTLTMGTLPLRAYVIETFTELKDPSLAATNLALLLRYSWEDELYDRQHGMGHRDESGKFLWSAQDCEKMVKALRREHGREVDTAFRRLTKAISASLRDLKSAFSPNESNGA